MTRLAILSDTEQKKFDRPPVFTDNERQLYFALSEPFTGWVTRIDKPINRIGFLIQLGYFRASGRFHPAASFRPKDIHFVCALFDLEEFDSSEFSPTVSGRHRQRILRELNWSAQDNATQGALRYEATALAANQAYPKDILGGLVDLCWKRRWVIPPYYELAQMITDVINETDRHLLSILDQRLETEHKNLLDELLTPIVDPKRRRSTVPLTKLKTSKQSLAPSELKQSMDVLKQFSKHYRCLKRLIEALPVGDQATQYHAQWLEKANHQQLTQFSDKKEAYLRLLAFIKHQFFVRQDLAIDALLKSVTAMKHAANAQLVKHDQERKPARTQALRAMTNAHLSASAFVQSVIGITRSKDATASEKYRKIEAMVNDYLAITDTESVDFDLIDEQLIREEKNVSYIEILENLSLRLQRRVTPIVKSVQFDEGTSDTDLIQAVQHFQQTDGNLGVHPPMKFLSKREKEAIGHQNAVSVSLYKCLLFIHIASGIKSGRLNLKYSYRYRAIQTYLIPKHRWEKEKVSILDRTGLSAYSDATEVLSELKLSLAQYYQDVNARYLGGKNDFLTVNDQGRCRVRTPKTNYSDHSYISTTLSQPGIISIVELLKIVNKAVDFTSEFKHFGTKRVKIKPSEETLIAGIVGNGCNIGLGRLAKISHGVKAHQIRNTVNWCFSLKNIAAANRKLVEAITGLTLANNYVQRQNEDHTSSDGRKITVAVDCLHANYSYKYFGRDKGVTDYTFVDERQALFHSRVFSASDREAPYVIDGLIDNKSQKEHIHSTDTHGYTEQIFAVSHLLGISFAPRLANIGKQQIYGFSTKATYRKKGYAILPSRTINQRLILKHWDEILRFIATIRIKHTSASQLFKRLSSYALDHPLYRALKEFGRVIKSQFILTYYDDLLLRQRIQKQLNRVELANKFSDAVFFDNDRAFQSGSLEHQEVSTACKVLIQNSIVLWNYLKLSEIVIDTKSPDKRSQLVDAIQRGSVLTWSHVNLKGEYDFLHRANQEEYFDMQRINALRV